MCCKSLCVVGGAAELSTLALSTLISAAREASTIDSFPPLRRAFPGCALPHTSNADGMAGGPSVEVAKAKPTAGPCISFHSCFRADPTFARCGAGQS